MMTKAVLLDTSFFLRFLNERDPLFKNADGYYRYFLEKEYTLCISTISIAEYCVRGRIDELPLKNLRIIPFNVNHATRTGDFARILYSERNARNVQFKERVLIPNDSKLFAQADVEINIQNFVTSDSESLKAYGILKKHTNTQFSMVDINVSHADRFGILPL